MITDLYRKNDGKSVFKRVYVFSPSVHADPAWLPVKKFVQGDLKVPKEEQWAWGHYDPGALQGLIATQKEVIAAAKEKKVRKMFNILIVTMITDLYRKKDGKSVFERVYVFSPAAHADPAWLPVQKFVEGDLEAPKSEQ